MRGRGQSIFKTVGAIIHSKICYLLLTKAQLTIINNFFRELLFKTKPMKNGILPMNTKKVARACGKSFLQ